MNVLGKNDVRNALLAQNRNYQNRSTWGQMFAQTDLAAQQAESALKYDYAQDVAEAYSAAYDQKSAIYGSNYGTGYKQAFADDIDAALNEAYETSRANYYKQLESVSKATAQANQGIVSALNTETDYMQNYLNSHIDYAKYLYNAINEGIELPGVSSDLFKNAGWKEFVDFDESGNVKDFKSDDLIREMLRDPYTGDLSAKGQALFKMLQTDLSTGGKYSFQQYLEEQDARNKTNIAEWAASHNPYDVFNIKANTAKDILGLDNTDNKFTTADKFMTADKYELDTMLNNAQEAIDADFVSYDRKRTGLDTYSYSGTRLNENAITQMNKLQEFAELYGVDISNFSSEYATLYDELYKLYIEYATARDDYKLSGNRSPSEIKSNLQDTEQKMKTLFINALNKIKSAANTSK